MTLQVTETPGGRVVRNPDGTLFGLGVNLK
jgi:hypothetical protein